MLAPQRFLCRTDAMSAQSLNIAALRDFLESLYFAPPCHGFIALLAWATQAQKICRRPLISAMKYKDLLCQETSYPWGCASLAPSQRNCGAPREGCLLIRFWFQSIDRSQATLYSSWWHLAKWNKCIFVGHLGAWLPRKQTLKLPNKKHCQWQCLLQRPLRPFLFICVFRVFGSP